MKDPKHKTLIDRLNFLIINLGDKISWVYLFIVIISIYEVLMRYIFNSPTVWVHETSLSLSAILMVFAGLYAFAKDKHISISIVVDLLPKKTRAVCRLISDVICLFYMALLSVSMLLITKQALFSPDGQFQFERSGSSWNSVFPGVVKLFISIFILLFVVQIFLDMISKAKNIKSSCASKETH